MSDLEEEYESDVEVPDSDKEEEKLEKSITSKKVIPTQHQTELDVSSDDEENMDSDIDIDDDDDDDDIQGEPSEDQTDPAVSTLTTNIQKTLISNSLSPINSDVESDDEDDLQKFDVQDHINYISKYHPECLVANSDEVNALCEIIRQNGKIIDKNHMTNPMLTKYEKTKILGQRTKQLNSGCKPYIEIPSNIIDNYLIAQMELKAKKIPVIIRRPISSTKSEYWKLEDLEQIN